MATEKTESFTREGPEGFKKEKTKSEFYLELLSFMAQKGFIWGPEPEIYGGLAGFYTYAPLGKLLKNNVENEIRRLYTKNGFWK